MRRGRSRLTTNLPRARTAIARFAELIGWPIVVAPGDPLCVRPNVPYHHIFRARRIFSELVQEYAGSFDIQSKVVFRRSGKAVFFRKFFRQFLIKAYELPFCAAHQLVAEGQPLDRPIMVGSVGPLRLQCLLFEALNGRPMTRWESIPAILISAAYFIKNVALGFLGVSFAFAVGLRLALKGRASRRTARQLNIVWQGHGDSTGGSVATLSETLFWKDLCNEILREEGAVKSLALLSLGFKKNQGELSRNRDLSYLKRVFDLPANLRAKAALPHFRLALRLGVSIRYFNFIASGFFVEAIKANTAAATLSVAGVDVFVTTQSSYLGDYAQAGAKLAGIPVVMIHYSTNSVSPKFKAMDTTESQVYNYSSVDKHIVWNAPHARWMRDTGSLSSSGVVDVGPIMFAVPPEGEIQKGGEKKWVVGLFDVTPVTTKGAAAIGHGRGFYRTETVTKFLTDITEACRQVFGDDFLIVFKRKRKVDFNVHARDYVEASEKILSSLGSCFSEVPSDANPWIALAQCNIVLGVPFTSMVEAGSALGLDVAFYWPDEELDFTPYKEERLIVGKSALIEWLEALNERGVEKSADLHPIYETRRKLAAQVAAYTKDGAELGRY